MRSCVVCGSFYESNKDNLISQIKNCFSNNLGPGLPTENNKKDIVGIIVPHAGYFFSGACAAHAYKEIYNSKSKSFIIIGPNHHGQKSGISNKDWQTPLGIVKTNQQLAKKISENTDLEIDDEPHVNEHSIEVQLPFLQYLFDDFDICAISLGSDINLKKLGEDLSKIHKNEIFIISSDFTHYGLNFNYLPFVTNIEKNLESLNLSSIKKIQNKNIEDFLNHIKTTKDTICGKNGIIVFLNIIKNIKTKSNLLSYYKSSDIIPDKMNSVSYISISFEKK
ncbi:AmmeMemoRadiSam system protein B [archaeon]|jgi:MEMO1 family protein|nr:AmmeMemoRadiSam system protein B [archaeon]MBT4023098.1 AmmeMemoRadiSam system protein B [archaeon]MBT4272496.1 AmmeMemoRadiSam system protein B [archaeon]MBT4460594.1 AmmeMemoRadiSam system protein B [archaeon]MBT4857816.1 AmmeMemoRadiSam system protein B [archaeon]